MTPERLEYFKDLATNRHLYSRDWIVELVNELEQLQLENEQLKFLYLESGKVISEVIEENNRLKRTVKALKVTAIGRAIEDSLEERED